MSVEPWIDACPRSAMMPPPGRPMLPSSNCRIDAARIICVPVVWCVQPTEYTNAVVRSRPEFSQIASATLRKSVCETPQTRCTISGV
jgi:hypothetical protein